MTEYRDFADEWQQGHFDEQEKRPMTKDKTKSQLHSIDCTLREAVTALRVIARALILLVLFQFLHYIL